MRDASKIVVMKGGCIVESGSHDELLAAGGMYKDLVRRQLDPDAGSTGRKKEEEVSDIVIH